MNNNDFNKIAQEFLKNSNKTNRLNNFLQSNDGREFTNKLNNIAKNNPSVNNAINSAKIGDIQTAANSLKGMLGSKEGAELASLISKILGE